MIYDKDVIDFLSAIESNSTDLIVADPPYGIDKDFNIQNNWRSVDEWARWCEKWLIQCHRILRGDGAILLYGIHNFLCYNHVYLYKIGMKYRRQFIWHYENGFCGNRKLPRATYEPILWFTKGEKYYFKEIREPYKSADRLKYPIKKKGKVWQPHPEGRIVGDVWNIPTLAGKRFEGEKVDHPSQKPIALSERLLLHFSAPSSNIVIPFCGSGSECVAAFRNGRNFLSTEINATYRAIALSRLLDVGWDYGEESAISFNNMSGESGVSVPSG